MKHFGFLALIGCALTLLLMLIDVAAFKPFLLALLMLLISQGRLEESSFNPFFLFIFTPLSALIYEPAISQFFLVPFEKKVALLIALSLLAFTIGLMTVRGNKVSHVTPRQFRFWPIFLLGLLPAVIGIITSGILSANDIEAARSNFYLPIIGQFWVFLPASIILAVEAGRRRLILLALAANVILPLLLVSKFATFLLALFIIYAIDRYGKGLTKALWWPSLLVIAIFSPLIFFTYFSARNELYIYEYQWWENVWFDSEILDKFGDMFYLPYLYATTPWSNLGLIVESNVSSQYGLLTLWPIISIAQLDYFYTPIEKPVRNIAMNTHTYIADFYIDFGFLGAFLMSFLLGVLVSKIYRRAIIGDALDQSLWVLVAFATFMMFFSNHFTSVGYPITAALLYFLVRKLPFMYRSSAI